MKAPVRDEVASKMKMKLARHYYYFLVFLLGVTLAYFHVLLALRPLGVWNPKLLLLGLPLALIVLMFGVLWGARHSCLWTLLLLAISCGFAVVLYVATLSYNSAWCCARTWDEREMCELTNHVGDLLQEHLVRHWLCGKTLLAAMRNGMLIPWDIGTQVCVESADFRQVTEMLKIAGHHAATTPDGLALRIIPASKTWYDLSDAWLTLFAFNSSFEAGATTATTMRASLCGRDWLVEATWKDSIRSQFGRGWRRPKLPEATSVQGWTCGVWMDGCSVKQGKTSDPSIGEILSMVWFQVAALICIGVSSAGFLFKQGASGLTREGSTPRKVIKSFDLGSVD